MNILPQVTLPTYPFVIPSSGKVIQYRPYTVGEEKILLTALESEDFNQILSSIRQLINACTDGSVKPKELTTYDFEILFLHIKSKSSGEQLSINLINKTCKKKEGKAPCDKATEVFVDLSEVKAMAGDVEFDPKKKSDLIQITDDIGVMFRHPSFDDLKIGEVLFDKNTDTMTELQKAKKTSDLQDKLIATCMVSIYSKDTVVNTSDVPLEDRVKWVQGLHPAAKKKLEEYFDRVPTIKHKVEFKCAYCDYKTDHILEGIRSFFD